MHTADAISQVANGPRRTLNQVWQHPFLRYLRANPTFLVGTLLVIMWCVIAISAPWIAPYSPVKPHPAEILAPPSMRHLFGTDKDGLDIFSRVLYAPQIDLSISLTSTLISAVLGTPMGAMAGYFSGRRGLAGLLADWTMRAVDMTLAFPVFVLALLLVGTLGAQIFNVVLALVFVNAPVFVWLTRSEVLGMRQRQFVEAARCSGNSELRVVLSHVIPNSISSSLTQVSVMLGYGILLTAGLSFIGAGVRVPTPEWGLMISQGATDMITGQWWPALFPGLALGSAVLGFSLAGDGLRGYLNPKTRTVQIRGR